MSAPVCRIRLEARFLPRRLQADRLPRPLLLPVPDRRVEHHRLPASRGGAVRALGGADTTGVPLQPEAELLQDDRRRDLRGAGAPPRRPARPHPGRRRLRAGRRAAPADARVARSDSPAGVRLPPQSWAASRQPADAVRVKRFGAGAPFRPRSGILHTHGTLEQWAGQATTSGKGSDIRYFRTKTSDGGGHAERSAVPRDSPIGSRGSIPDSSLEEGKSSYSGWARARLRGVNGRSKNRWCRRRPALLGTHEVLNHFGHANLTLCVGLGRLKTLLEGKTLESEDEGDLVDNRSKPASGSVQRPAGIDDTSWRTRRHGHRRRPRRADRATRDSGKSRACSPVRPLQFSRTATLECGLQFHDIAERGSGSTVVFDATAIGSTTSRGRGSPGVLQPDRDDPVAYVLTDSGHQGHAEGKERLEALSRRRSVWKVWSPNAAASG